jgi:hypothetical protein
LTTLLRVVLGTAVYVLIVLLAAPFPAAAGMMLVFPTLNGLGYVLSERDQMLPMAASMIWMPLINAVLCAAYLLTFILLARFIASGALSWSLLAAAVLLLVFIVRRPFVQKGIPLPYQLAFATGATFAGVVVAAAIWVVLMQTDAKIGTAASAVLGSLLSLSFVANVISRNATKITVFVVIFAALLVAPKFVSLSNSWRGVLAGFPIVPLGGVWSLTAGAEANAGVLAQMAVSVWIGATIAIWFVYAFPRALVRLAPGSVRSFAALIIGWLLCGLAVAAASSMIG